LPVVLLKEDCFEALRAVGEMLTMKQILISTLLMFQPQKLVDADNNGRTTGQLVSISLFFFTFFLLQCTE
jgi:hypothetical protein